MRVSAEHIDAVYDSITMMRLFSQRLSEGEVDDQEAGEMSWLLGSAKKHLEPVIGLLEAEMGAQERCPRGPQDEVLEIGAQMLAVMEKFRRRRQTVENGENAS